MILKRNVCYTTSFVAGGVLLACELLITKLIGPYFGASLYVWAATIGTTLIGLALGYFYSGKLSFRKNITQILMIISLVTGVYLFVLPFFSSIVMEALLKVELVTGVLLSTFIFNFPLFFLFGLFSPLIIQSLSSSIEDSGKYAGRIYGISTISGVLFLIIISVFSLPYLGSKISIFICASLMLGVGFLNFAVIKYEK